LGRQTIVLIGLIGIAGSRAKRSTVEELKVSTENVIQNKKQIRFAVPVTRCRSGGFDVQGKTGTYTPPILKKKLQ
jgi:hypothetical protein